MVGSSGISPSPLPFSLCGVLREVISLSPCLTAETWGISRAPTGKKLPLSTDQSSCQKLCTKLYLHCTATGGFIVLKQQCYPVCNQDFLLHFISGTGADSSAKWDSGGVSGLETPRAFILVLDGTSALFHAGLNLRFKLTLLYLIFCLFMLSHCCSAPGIYACPVHWDRCGRFSTLPD